MGPRVVTRTSLAWLALAVASTVGAVIAWGAV